MESDQEPLGFLRTITSAVQQPLGHGFYYQWLKDHPDHISNEHAICFGSLSISIILSGGVAQTLHLLSPNVVI